MAETPPTYQPDVFEDDPVIYESPPRSTHPARYQLSKVSEC